MSSSSQQQANSASSSSTQIRRDDLVLDNRAREAVDRVADDYWQKRAQQGDNQEAMKELEENGGENSMLSEMMNAALGARKEEEDKQDREQQERVKSKSFGEGLFKKGFLKKKKKNGQSIFGSGDTKSTTESKQVVNASQSSGKGGDKSGSDDIPYISKPKKDDDTDENLRFPEVQEAMREKLGDQKWMNEDLLKKISGDHRIARGLQDPRCQQAIEDMQKDPSNAKEKYKNDPEVTEFLQAFTGLLGEHFKQMGEKEGEQDREQEAGKTEGQSQEGTENFDDVMRQIDAEKLAEKAKRREVAQDDDDVRDVLSDPQVVSLLTDPNMQRILEESRNDPSKFSQYLKDPDTRAKLMTLQKAGLIRIEQ